MNDRGGENLTQWGKPTDGDFLTVDADFDVPFTYRLRFTEDVFDPANATFANVIASPLGRQTRSLVMIDSGVFDAWPGIAERIETYFHSHARVLQIAGRIEPVTGGEQAKNDSSVVERTQQLINEHGICRQSYVIAIGGGAMLDAVGYGASTAHRGVRLVRIPTTTLAQGDAGIGIKNGINAFGKKNFLGSFNLPWAVINDSRFLTTLSDRDWRCGLSEAVKVALVKDAAYFETIASAAAKLRARDEAVLPAILQRCAELHLQHIVDGGDPFELTTARPLDFGHWAAHKLEQMTNFALRHGEAVAIGLAIDVQYSALSGRIAARDAEAACACLTKLGFHLSHEALSDMDLLLQGLEEFREHLGGELTIALLAGIGEQVDVHEIDLPLMRRAIETVRKLRPPSTGY